MITRVVAAFRTTPLVIKRMTLDTMHLFQVKMNKYFLTEWNRRGHVWDCFRSGGPDTTIKLLWSIESFA